MAVTTFDKAKSYAAAMTDAQLTRVVRRFDRAEKAGHPPMTAYILAVLQERAAIFANLPPRDPRAEQPKTIIQ